MNSPIIQLLVLAGIAVFLILRLKNVLGTREGFEKPPAAAPTTRKRPELEVIEGGPDLDIADHTDGMPEAAEALAKMKAAEPSFGVSDFLGGARGAYEMILMGFERGDLADIKPFLDDDVYESFAEVVELREKQGLSVEASFVGIREMALADATFDNESGIGEVSVKFIGEMTSVVRDNAGEIVEGDEKKIKRQKDVWTFARKMGADDPNWQLVATGE
ncbi:Tim44/TimA family putative adaptor protein [Planktotalea sp.]|uniref:Tim44/TimA family putative adaptor protein n=1 Tax=Planktotalea sp. TaxID=2029877 RepID=UPI0035C834DF